jgi:nicotinamidase-related amidase
MPEMKIDAATTALVAIDLQYGIVAMTTAPHEAAAVVTRTKAIADSLRTRGGTIVMVRVSTAPDGRDALAPLTDSPTPPAGKRAANWSQFKRVIW